MNDIQFLRLIERLVIAVITCIVVAVAVFIITIVCSFEMVWQENVIIPAPPQNKDNRILYPDQSNDRVPGDSIGPDIRHCLDNARVNLWECIRNAEYLDKLEKASG